MNFEWHDLRLNKDDFTDKDNERTILFYVKDYPAFDKNFEFPYYHYAIENYSLSFLEENTYLFCEHSKGYECEYLPKQVLGWCYLSTESEEDYAMISYN